MKNGFIELAPVDKKVKTKVDRTKENRLGGKKQKDLAESGEREEIQREREREREKERQRVGKCVREREGNRELSIEKRKREERECLRMFVWM